MGSNIKVISTDAHDDSYCIGVSSYNRSKVVGFQSIGQCDACNDSETQVMSCDSSDGEYGDISLCKYCVYKIFDRSLAEIQSSDSSHDCIKDEHQSEQS